ncbi:MAG: histone deacetylase [Candidatus Cloacimonetes bacterium]|nr:histone deacetylase [Candidatus Cloacimonadota bacterium]MCF7812968.1 histone deacetylase [Candidatus Cloacimonadota bacterium]MCF7867300.1 histone deacetylase [Candidatus Cloacimonadota bacterium]MCF7882744.1 histone deacetylase [Candidatus Cloacimonadota bacterium]
MHPENKKRLSSLGELPVTELESGEEYLELIHTKEYIRRMKKFSENESGHVDPETIISKGSYEAAIYAVGATIMASKTGDFALTRPPGHHAHPDRSSGFCLFNNIAIAAKYHANQGKKVLIIDIDGHLGCGTNRIFYDSDQVMYWSLHEYPAFPGGGDANEIGTGKGEGYTINVPLPAESGDEIFMEAFETFLPVAKEFNPDIVGISAGFDAHQYDLLLNLRVSVNLFHKIGKMISQNFDNVFATLEGGYNIEMFPRCLYNFLDGINNKKMRFKERNTDSMIQTFYEYEGRKALAVHNLKKFWKSI